MSLFELNKNNINDFDKILDDYLLNVDRTPDHKGVEYLIIGDFFQLRCRKSGDSKYSLIIYLLDPVSTECNLTCYHWYDGVSHFFDTSIKDVKMIVMDLYKYSNLILFK